MEDLLLSILLDTSLLQRYQDNLLFQMNVASLWNIEPSEYRNVYIEEVFDDNKQSGVYLYRLSWKGEEIIAIRGSEESDDITHKTGWQDWRDNFEMYTPGPTLQQLVTLHYMHSLDTSVKRILCGHSKGGNLCLFSLMAGSLPLFTSITNVYAFNAPGITDSLMRDYAMRLESNDFIDKVALLENEHDCISSFFNHVKEPTIIASRLTSNNVQQLYENHQLHAMHIVDGVFQLTNKKSVMPRLVQHFINDFFVKLPPERLQRMVIYMDDYFNSGLSKAEMYKVLIYQIAKYTNIFDELAYEDVASITFQQLLDRRRSKILVQRIKKFHPTGTVTMFIRSIKEENPLTKLADLDMRAIGDACIENYEATLSSTAEALRHVVSINNAKIMDAIKRIQDR